MGEGELQGMRHVYKLIDLSVLGLGVSALPQLLASVERAGFDGLSVTHPCKQAVIPHLDELSDEARLLGAVNTVVLSGGRRSGHNTDWIGFSEAFRRELGDLERGRIVQLGAGGAGAAVAHAVLSAGAGELTLFDAEPDRAAALMATLSTCHPGRIATGLDLAAAVARADGLINATPVGMHTHPGMPLPGGLLRSGLWVADVIYHPAETELLRRARALGARTMNGGGMLVFQAVEQFRLFTGVLPDADRMWSRFAALHANGTAPEKA